jgi:glucokinase
LASHPAILAMRAFVIIGDIGGTSSRLEMVDAYAPRGVHPKPIFKHTYHSGFSHPNLAAMLKEFSSNALATGGGDAHILLYSLSVCGPVTNGKSILLAPCFLRNGADGWHLDQADLANGIWKNKMYYKVNLQRSCIACLTRCI